MKKPQPDWDVGITYVIFMLALYFVFIIFMYNQ